LAIALAKTNADKIIGLDISSGMLDIGKQKILKENLEKTIDMVLATLKICLLKITRLTP